jgi:hypothetical protein
MGRVGSAFDNAMAESFFATLKAELVYRRAWPTRHELEMEVFSYIEGFACGDIHSVRIVVGDGEPIVLSYLGTGCKSIQVILHCVDALTHAPLPVTGDLPGVGAGVLMDGERDPVYAAAWMRVGYGRGSCDVEDAFVRASISGEASHPGSLEVLLERFGGYDRYPGGCLIRRCANR